MSIVFVEGVPGSGKSSMAEKLCVMAAKAGIGAMWYLEESHDHPVHPKPWHALKSNANFVEECLRSWSNFAELCKGQEILHILEGSAFQSTVRFMMEKRQSGIEHYFHCFEDIVNTLNPRMVYLRPFDVAHHSESICKLRGEQWSNKVCEYVTTTDYSVFNGLTGINGMHRFWGDYASLCDRIVADTSIPTKTINVVQGEWERHMAEAAFLGLEQAACTDQLNG